MKSLAGYEGVSMKERFGENFDILFTAGSGTFGQYASYGRGVAASANGRKRNEPVEKLTPYSHISVRVGGWNAPFISLPDEQQDDYIKRFLCK